MPRSGSSRTPRQPDRTVGRPMTGGTATHVQSSGPPMLADQLGRPLRNLRLSVTDRCNLRCQYCMPEMDYVWLPRQDILEFEEIGRLVDVFTTAGVDRLRLTGGEPLVRRDLQNLVRILASKSKIRHLALTTNGVLL